MSLFANTWIKEPSLVLLIIALIILIGLFLSPRYLVYADPPQKSDIIIIFPGPGMEDMQKEARQLIADGLSGYLCIPTSFSLYRASQDRTGLTAVRFPDVEPGIDKSRPRNGINAEYFKQIRREGLFPRFYENTHVEMLLAQKVMEDYGFRKAIFVGSPYHMKRIKIMSEKVFDSAYDIKIVPTRFEKKFGTPLPSRKDMEHVFTEFPKLVWFLCYDFWDHLIGANPRELQKSVD